MTPADDGIGGMGNRFFVEDPLVRIDDAYHVRLGQDVLPFLHGDQPVRSFLPGWEARALFTGFAPLLLLELVNGGTGARATWFLDHRMHMMGNHPGTLRPDLLRLLRVKALPLLQAMVGQVTERAVPALDERMRAFLRVNEATKAMIGALCQENLVCPPIIYPTGDLAQRSVLYLGGDGAEVSVDRDHLDRGLRDAWQDRLAGFVEAGRMTWPSPVDGHEVDAQGSLVFDDFHFAHRFADLGNGLVFFVVVADHLSRIAGVWIPAAAVLAARDGAQLDLARRVGTHLPHWVVSHALAWADGLVPYLRRGAARFASVTRAPPGLHLGHQLWNELSGIDRFIGRRPPALPDWIVLDAAGGSELYGPTDAIFPELAGRIERGIDSIAALIAHAHAHGLFILRITDEFVSAGLRRRILDRVDAARVAATVRETMAALHPPVAILIGLRVENRTLSDLKGGLLLIVDHLVRRHPGLVVVFDGHNALTDDGSMLGSHGEAIARRRPVDVERELVSTVRASFAKHPVTILDTIGAPMSASLAWTAACDGFLSPWGASLAKYRWVCNRPGYIFSNRTNLLLRDALHIYSDPRYMEDPSPVTFIDPALVRDDPGTELLVNTPPDDPGTFNFHVDIGGMLAEIGRFVDGLADRRPRR